MARLSAEVLRHALQTAREHGFAQVELESEQGLFSAVLDPAAPKAKPATAATEEAPKENTEKIRAGVVGYYREAKTPLAVGLRVKAGTVVASVNALGLANDVESPVDGEVVEVLVEPNQPVEFGQPLAVVRIG